MFDHDKYKTINALQALEISKKISNLSFPTPSYIKKSEDEFLNEELYKYTALLISASFFYFKSSKFDNIKFHPEENPLYISDNFYKKFIALLVEEAKLIKYEVTYRDLDLATDDGIDFYEELTPEYLCMLFLFTTANCIDEYFNDRTNMLEGLSYNLYKEPGHLQWINHKNEDKKDLQTLVAGINNAHSHMRTFYTDSVISYSNNDISDERRNSAGKTQEMLMNPDFDSFMELSQKNYDKYRRLKGERKLNKIVYRINNSKHTASLLYQSRQNRIVPTSKDFGSSVMSNLTLALAGKETVRFAASYVLEKWHNEVNQPLELANEQQVITLFNKINKNLN